MSWDEHQSYWRTTFTLIASPSATGDSLRPSYAGAILESRMPHYYALLGREMPKGTTIAVIVVLALVLVAGVLVYSYLPRTTPSGSSSGNPPGGKPQCKGT